MNAYIWYVVLVLCEMRRALVRGYWKKIDLDKLICSSVSTIVAVVVSRGKKNPIARLKYALGPTTSQPENEKKRE